MSLLTNTNNPTKAITSGVQGAGSIISTVVANNLKFDNLKNSPDNVKKYSGIISSDIITSAISPIIKIDYVSDIVKCARLIEMYGYKINKLYSSQSFNFNNFNIRYYYNVLKFSECSITLNILNDNETVNNIISRLTYGIRLWNNYSDVIIGDFTYDNVENEFIE